MDTSADIKIFFRDFGTPALIGDVPVDGLLDIPSKTISVLDIGVGSQTPRYSMESRDILRLGIDSGSLVTIPGIEYRSLLRAAIDGGTPVTAPGDEYLVSGPPDHDGEGVGVLTLENA